jgi:hypothetical protein
MLQNVFRFRLYADQIILVKPFDNPHCLADQYNPIVHPEEWRIQTLRLVYHLRILAPWIAAGIVLMVPDPGDFDYQLRIKSFGLATARFGKIPLSELDIDRSSTARRFRDILDMSPQSYLDRMAREAVSGITDSEVADVLKHFENRHLSNPLLPAETLDKMPGQLNVYRSGANLETGLLMCQMMGAFPYTNIPFRWREILTAGDQLGPDAQVWSPLTNAFSNLDFKFLNNVDTKFAVAMREEGRLASFRTFMRKVWKTVGGEPDLSKAPSLARDFSDELKDEYGKAQAEWSAIDRDILKWAVPAIGGVLAAAGGLVTGHYTLAVPSAGLAVNGVNELIQSHMKRSEFRKKTALSVFIDLESKK